MINWLDVLAPHPRPQPPKRPNLARGEFATVEEWNAYFDAVFEHEVAIELIRRRDDPVYCDALRKELARKKALAATRSLKADGE